MSPFPFMMQQGKVDSKGMPIFQTPGKHEVKQQINPTLFKNYLPLIGQQQWNNLISSARAQGISDEDIQAGLQMIQKMR